MRWTSVFVYLSAAALVAAVVAEVGGWPAAVVQWLLLAWVILLSPLAAALFRYPMRAPAWGLFLGFWGSLSVLTLVILQSLAVAGVLQQPSRTFAESFPLAVFAAWVLVTSALGAEREGEDGVGVPVAALGVLTGLALIAASVIAWTGAAGPERPAFFAAAVAYVIWAAGLSGELWSWHSHRTNLPAGPPLGEAGNAGLPATPAEAAV